MAKLTHYGFYFDSRKCTGCKACHIACKDRMQRVLRPETDVTQVGVDSLQGMLWRRVYEYGGGDWIAQSDGSYSQNVFAYYLSLGCNHCAKPVCVKVCPAKAMTKNQDTGLVQVDADLCIGCNSCARACPYDAPQMDSARRVMTKCDGCAERLEEGLQPECVAACPLRALDFDTMENLQAKYGLGDGHIAPLPVPATMTPNLIIKASRHAQLAGSGNGRVLNPAEV